MTNDLKISRDALKVLVEIFRDCLHRGKQPTFSAGDLRYYINELNKIANHSEEPHGVVEPAAWDKYDDVLIPFVAMMRAELHANAGKGDRPGWLEMDRKTALLEIFYHLGKLQKAVKNGDQEGIGEYAADVANMSMMMADICGCLDKVKEMNK